MRAVVIPTFGGPDVLEVADLPEPQPRPGEVTIDVAFAGVNYVEVMFRRGDMGINPPLPFVPGIEVAGYIRTVGEDVQGLHIGQPVAAMSISDQGGYAEVVRVPALMTFPLDSVGAGNEVDLAIAAGSLSSTITAYLALSAIAQLRSGEAVLVQAAAGGLGSALGQMARRLGAGLVLGVVGSNSKVDYARSLGYDEVLLQDNFVEGVAQVTAGRGVDIVLDQVGGAIRTQSLDVLRPLGRLVVLGNASNADDVPQSSNGLWFTNKAVMGCTLGSLFQVEPELTGSIAREAMGMVFRGEVDTKVTDIYPLEQAAEAHRRLEQRATTGKLVLRVAD